MSVKDRQSTLPDTSALAADYWQAITPSDTVALSPRPRALLVTVTGSLVLKDQAGNSVTLTAVSANAILDLSPTFVMAATTATVVGLY